MNELILIAVTLLASAFFSGMEIAYIASDKLRLELEKDINILNSKLISRYTQHPGNYIATMLIGNNIALVMYGLAFAKIVEPYFFSLFQSDGLVLLLQTVLSTIVILFVAEFIPKTLFRFNPNFAINLFAIPVGFFYFLFYPISRFSIAFSTILLKRLFRTNIAGRQEEKVFSKVDLSHFVSTTALESQLVEASGTVDSEIRLFRNALDFSKVKLRECMVPRPEIEALEITADIDRAKQRFVETGHSKILIYKESIDSIIGYIHTSDLFDNPLSIDDCLHSVTIVPETMDAKKLLSKFLQEHKSIAVVVDEFGGTAGMITTEDILEEIFGEIEDEHDSVDVTDRKISDSVYVFSGRMEIDAVNEKYNLNLPVDENYETVAGFILHAYASIPKANSSITIDNFKFKILRGSKTRIELVELQIVS